MTAQIVPLRSVRPIADAELSRIVGDPDAAFRHDNIVDFNQRRVSREYIRRCKELDAQCRDLPPLRETRQYSIEPRIGFDPPIPLWFRIYIAVALVVSVVVWFL